jgi:hypothetical protein
MLAVALSFSSLSHCLSYCRSIAGLIGRRLNAPVVSKSPAEAAKHFSFLAPFIPMDNPTSSRLTQERLGWRPTQPGLLADLDQAHYFK